MAKVMVVGSINSDLVVQVERYPHAGETLNGSELAWFPGGKGANQAVAASRLGAKVTMVGAVGRDLVNGLPKTITLHSTEIQQALSESLLQVLEAVRATLEDCPPELSGDIVDRGVMITGGGALLNGIQDWFSEEISVPVHLAPNPLESVAVGTGRSLKFIDKLQKATV